MQDFAANLGFIVVEYTVVTYRYVASYICITHVRMGIAAAHCLIY